LLKVPALQIRRLSPEPMTFLVALT
jgi:hypothetical protein